MTDNQDFYKDLIDNLYVSVSRGATLWLPDDTPESVPRRTDALMYQSKREDRNRSTVG